MLIQEYEERREAHKEIFGTYNDGEVENEKLNVDESRNVWHESSKDPNAKASQICPICKEVIYLHTEGFSFYGERYHMTCYKCINCDKKFNKNDKIIHREKKPYCQKCYLDVFREELTVQTKMDADDPVQVQGSGMIFDKKGGENFDKLFTRGILTKRLKFMTMTVENHMYVYPEIICAFGNEPMKLQDIPEETLEKWLSIKTTTRKNREKLFAQTTQEEYELFVQSLLIDGPEKPKLGWITLTYPEGNDTFARTLDKTFIFFWNPAELDKKEKVVFSAARDELGRRWPSKVAWEAETTELLDFELILKRAQKKW